MKLVNAFLVSALFLTGAAASAKSLKPQTPYSRALNVAHDFVDAFVDQKDTCDVRLKETRDGFTLSVKEGKKPVIYIDVAEDSKIKFSVKGDDDFSHEVLIGGEGYFSHTHMDDAYDHFYAKKNGVEAECELDY